jgi:hypothetical protein
VYHWLDVLFLVIFTVEFAMKVVDSGFYFTPAAYLRDNYNRLDFVVLILSYVDFFTGESMEGIGRSLRLLRVLRPLRLLSKNEGMQMIVDAFLRALPALGYVVVLTAFIFLIFSIVGMSLFLGNFYRCNDASAASKGDCVGTTVSDEGVVVPQVWSRPYVNFDNAWEAFVALFQVSTLSGWLSVLFDGMDVTERNRQPREDASWPNAFFFVVFILFSSFFFFQLFVGVFVDSFNRFRGTALLTDKQRAWVELQRSMLRISPIRVVPPPKSQIRLLLFRVVRHRWFDVFIFVCIILNVAFMAAEFYGQPQSWSETLSKAHSARNGFRGRKTPSHCLF